MKIFRSCSFLVLFSLSQILSGCLEGKPPHIETGRDFNGYERRVMDTLSEFKINETMNIQLYNESSFDVDSIELRLYAGTTAAHAEPLFTQKVSVNPNSQDLIIRGSQNKPLSARGLLRTSKVGAYYLEFRNGPLVIAGKDIQLHNSKE
jgi:hypothetical protein